LYANGQRIAMHDKNNRRHLYLNDHLGSARVLVDSAGTKRDIYKYCAFVSRAGGQPGAAYTDQIRPPLPKFSCWSTGYACNSCTSYPCVLTTDSLCHCLPLSLSNFGHQNSENYKFGYASHGIFQSDPWGQSPKVIREWLNLSKALPLYLDRQADIQKGAS
jgi:hypothetical protein